MRQKININSQLDALKVKEMEKIFYEKIIETTHVVPKVTPFRGINTDLLFIKDNQILFIKFMDTTEELFYILDEELIEVMNEEFELLKLKMAQHNSNIRFNYVFIMPYVNIEDSYGFENFVNNNILDKNKIEEIIDGKNKIEKYFSEANNEIELNLYLLDICPEYYVLNGQYHLNKNYKKITFTQGDYNYSATMLTKNQLEKSISINYGKSLIRGGSGTGKTSLLLSRAIKVSRIYPHHNFIIFTHTKQLCNELRETVDLLYKDNNNLEVHTISSFVLKLSKKYNLVLDYSLLKKDYERTFTNLKKQAMNVIKNKKIFKGIFIDESESFSNDDLEFIQQFLYEKKYIFNMYYCEGLNIYNNVNIFKKIDERIEFKEKIELKENFRQSKPIIEFTNNFSQNANKYIKNIRDNINRNIYHETENIIYDGMNTQIVKVNDLEDQINAILWEIEYLVKNKGITYNDIAIVYPYNKKKLKNGKTIYFQYLLKKALGDINISYIQGDENLTKYVKGNGITISNLYFIKNLEYKAVIFCELEMLYNQTVNKDYQDYQINDFVGDLNKIYTGISRACEYLTIVTTFDEKGSDLIKILMNSEM